MSKATAAPVLLRDAGPEDTAALAAIYGHHVRHGLATFEDPLGPPARPPWGWPWEARRLVLTAKGTRVLAELQDREALAS